MSGRTEGAPLKHDLRRGEIIWVLKQDYPHLVTFRHLQLALRDRNVPVSERDLETYLSYLEEGGFVRCTHHDDEQEARDRILAAALTAKGLLLLDKKITDPGVRYEGHADRFWALALALHAAERATSVAPVSRGLESEGDWYGSTGFGARDSEFADPNLEDSTPLAPNSEHRFPNFETRGAAWL